MIIEHDLKPIRFVQKLNFFNVTAAYNQYKPWFYILDFLRSQEHPKNSSELRY